MLSWARSESGGAPYGWSPASDPLPPQARAKLSPAHPVPVAALSQDGPRSAVRAWGRPGPLGRKALDELRRVLIEVIGELEDAWDRRNW